MIHIPSKIDTHNLLNFPDIRNPTFSFAVQNCSKIRHLEYCWYWQLILAILTQKIIGRNWYRIPRFFMMPVQFCLKLDWYSNTYSSCSHPLWYSYCQKEQKIRRGENKGEKIKGHTEDAWHSSLTTLTNTKPKVVQQIDITVNHVIRYMLWWRSRVSNTI